MCKKKNTFIIRRKIGNVVYAFPIEADNIEEAILYFENELPHCKSDNNSGEATEVSGVSK